MSVETAEWLDCLVDQRLEMAMYEAHVFNNMHDAWRLARRIEDTRELPYEIRNDAAKLGGRLQFFLENEGIIQRRH